MTVPRYALLGDMVGSRHVGNHRSVHRLLEGALEAVNRRFAAAVWAPLGLTKGVDEISGALLTPEPAYDILCLLNLHLHPLRFRFAVGWGKVFSLGSSRSAGSLDGSAFHTGVAALERARRERLPLALGGPPASPQARAVEALGGLDAALREDWPPVVAAVARAVSDHPEATQAELARHSHRSQQAVSRAMVRGRFKDLARSQAALREMLADIHRQTTQSAPSEHASS
jgi:hypothetical protein